MDGSEFYDFKMKRFPGAMTASEREIYESGTWTDWIDTGLRNGSLSNIPFQHQEAVIIPNSSFQEII